MFVLNDDLSIYATRGDIVFFSVSANEDGEPYSFKAGDVVRIKVYGKKDAESVVLQKDFPIIEDTQEVEIFLTEEDTKIGDVISKHKDYWYEIELNPYNNPQTIIGYDEDGAKVFRLFPEGDDIPEFVPSPEDIAVMDDELDMASTRPVQNQAIARAVVSLRAAFDEAKETITVKSNEAVESAAEAESAVAVERARIDNLIAHAENAKVSKDLGYMDFISEETKAKMDAKVNSDGVFATITVNLREANLIYGGTEMDVFIIPNECRPISVGVIHTEDGLDYIVNYDSTNKYYYLSLQAKDSVTVAPSGAGSVNMTYALGDYELSDIRIGADGETYESAGEAVRKQFSNVLNLQTDFTNLLPIWRENKKIGKLNGGTLGEPEYLDVRVVSNTNYGSYYVNLYVPDGCTKLMVLQKVKRISGDFSNYPHIYCYGSTNTMTDGATRLFRGSVELNGFEYYVNCVELKPGTKSIGIGGYSMKDQGVCEIDTNPVLFDISKFSNTTIEKFYNLLLTDVIEQYYEEYHGNAPYYAFYADEAEHAKTTDKADYAERSNRARSCYLAEPPAREKVTNTTEWSSTVTPTEDGFNIKLKETWGGVGFVREFIVGKKYLVIWQGTFADKVGFIKNSGSAWNQMSTKSIQVDGVNYYYGFAEAMADDKLDRILIHSRMSTESSVFDVTITELIPEFDITDEFVSTIIKGDALYIPELKERILNAEKAVHNHEWNNKNVLVIGDSLTAAGIWQKQLREVLGMNVTTHAKGGMGIVQCVDGENGAGEYDNETAASGTLYALNVNDVKGKDLIVFFAGYNNRGTEDGKVGDCYDPKTQSGRTIAGYTQYAINRIYEELAEAGNLTCRVVAITPHCAGKYGYIDADGYSEHPAGSGRTMRTLAQIMEDVAAYNSVPCLNLWETSGINRHTWCVFSASPTATNKDGTASGPYPYNNDQLHLNNAVGYPYLGKRIANWVQTI